MAEGFKDRLDRMRKAREAKASDTFADLEKRIDEIKAGGVKKTTKKVPYPWELNMAKRKKGDAKIRKKLGLKTAGALDKDDQYKVFQEANQQEYERKKRLVDKVNTGKYKTNFDEVLARTSALEKEYGPMSDKDIVDAIKKEKLDIHMMDLVEFLDNIMEG